MKECACVCVCVWRHAGVWEHMWTFELMELRGVFALPNPQILRQGLFCSLLN